MLGRVWSLLVIVGGLLLAVAAPAAGVSILVDTFQSPGDQFAGGAVNMVPFQEIAHSFVAPTNDFVTSVDLGLSQGSMDQAFVVRLWSDAGGVPGAVLAIRSGAGLLTQAPSVVQVPFDAPAVVTAGSTYWVSVGISSGAALEWHFALGAADVSASFRSGVGTWGPITLPRGAFRVIGVPEPSLGALLAIPTLTLLGGYRRRHCRNTLRDQ